MACFNVLDFFNVEKEINGTRQPALAQPDRNLCQNYFWNTLLKY